MSSLNQNIQLPNNQNQSAINTNISSMPGDITSIIGTGQNARDAIIYSVLRWCFWIGSIISLLVVYNNWFFREEGKTPELTRDLQNVWQIVTPLITLSLGYLFGKKSK